MPEPQPLPPSLVTMFAPILYAAGAALALGGGGLAMLAPEASAAGIATVLAGIGLVTSTTIFHIGALMRPPQTNQKQD